MSKARLEEAQYPTPQGDRANGRVCAAIKRDGSPCNAPASPGDNWCWNHNPAHADERKRNASRAGRTKPSSRVKDLDALLDQLYKDTRAGRVERGVAAVLTQVISARTRLIEVERRIAEVEGFEERVSQLEAIVADEARNSRRAGRW
jgi:hypothetical protein